MMDRFLTERITFVAKLGMTRDIEAYVKQYPEVWNNNSHFIRCAIQNFIKDQRRKGRHIKT